MQDRIKQRTRAVTTRAHRKVNRVQFAALAAAFSVSVAVAAMCMAVPAGAQTPERARVASGTTAGHGGWQQYASPAAVGLSVSTLARARAYADSVHSAAVMVVYRGVAVAAWGDVARPLELNSVRKSLMGALYGNAVASHRIDLDATLAKLGIDDTAHPLTPAERGARVRDIISARSGVFLPAAYAPEDQSATRPERGSHAPGTFWFYNNWDFNVAGVIYERATGRDIYQAFDEDIARPIGMQDYTPGSGFRVREPTQSEHPAMTFRMSARDLARFGQLILDNGAWKGKQVLPRGWVKEMLTSRSDLGDAEGYGYLWWIYALGSLSQAHYPALFNHIVYLAKGTGGQALWIVPDLDLVVVHRGDTDNGRNVAGKDAWAIAEMAAEALPQNVEANQSASAQKSHSGSTHAALVPMRAEALASQLPAPTVAHYLTLGPAALAQYAGEYDVNGAIARVFTVDGHLYGNFPGAGEAELFAIAPDTFTVRVQAGVSVTFERDAGNTIRTVILDLGDRTMRGTRR